MATGDALLRESAATREAIAERSAALAQVTADLRVVLVEITPAFVDELARDLRGHGVPGRHV